MATPFTIQPCTLKDSPAIARNNVSAFWRDENWVRSWRHTTLEQQIIEVSKRVPRNLLSDRSILRHEKAVDSTGKLVGYARWKLPESVVAAAKDVVLWPEAMISAVAVEEEAEIRGVAESAVFKPDYSNDDREFEELIGSTKRRLEAAKTYLILDYLAVHPENQGRGIASALVASGLQQARNMQLDVFVLAFQAGIGVYKRIGFEVLEQISTVYDADGDNPIPYTACFMEFKIGAHLGRAALSA